jgi:hypothetical protein
MEDSNNPTPDVNELQSQCQCLRRQVQITLILLIMVSVILTLFLQRQNKYATTDLNGVRPMIEVYTKTQAPMMDVFLKRLVDYSKTHPDFNAIYKKYGMDQLNAAPGAAPKK